ncbi:hypothetical protein McpSp1_04790 [Methanocorpusculaceae archaeon Sp1]|uniref:Signal transduction histidine kinase 5TM receptor LytS transmembrane region domain-containing protein n=1 Tax=Methanorbis furvi TaxID=3028299 RepID=A0AAE4MBI6_9EURY|nr:hypothetical protein [Methanocorpusculaceae archaeon Sp1]MDV0441114.1 hypothetical protein [Methanocorpusculaceae archaeon Ag1]
MDIVILACFLIINLGLAALSGYYLGKTKLLDIEGGKLTGWARNLCGIVIFGVISIIGTLSAIDVNGTILNNRDSGPVSGGLYFGPVIGIGAAAMSALFRVTQGGVTMIPCSLGTFFAGCIAAAAGYYFRDRPSIWLAAVIGVIVVLVHSILVIFLSEGGIEAGWHIVMQTPAAAGYGITVIISIILFSWTYKIAREKTE